MRQAGGAFPFERKHDSGDLQYALSSNVHRTCVMHMRTGGWSTHRKKCARNIHVVAAGTNSNPASISYLLTLGFTPPMMRVP